MHHHAYNYWLIILSIPVTMVVTLATILAMAIAAVLMLVFAVSLGPIVLSFALLGSIAALLYNSILSNTSLIWFPYILGSITLPIAVWIALERFDPKRLALAPIGLQLLFGVHLAQTLPDVESDLRVGVRGLAVTFGRECALRVARGACIAAE